MHRIPLPLRPQALARLVGGPGPTYRACYAAVLDGRIPARREDNGRWTVASDDLLRAAMVLGFQAAPPTMKPEFHLG